MVKEFFALFSPFALVEALTFYGGGKGGGDAPDYSQIAASQAEAARYAKAAAEDDLAFRKEQYYDSLPRLRQLQDLASNIASSQSDAMQFNNNAAREQWDSYNSTYRPMELQTAMDAIGSQYLGDGDRQQLVDMLTKPQYDVEDVYGVRSKPNTTEYDTIKIVDKKGRVVFSNDGQGNIVNNGMFDEKGNFLSEKVPKKKSGTGLETLTGMAAYANNQLGNKSTSEEDDYEVISNSDFTKALKAKGFTATRGKGSKTDYTEEKYVTGQNKSLNKDYEASRALLLDNLSRKAQDAAANEAIQRSDADVNSAFTIQSRNLARMGLDPSRLVSATAGLAQNQALAKTGAANQARTAMRAQQQGLRTGVANFGRNMPNTAGQTFGVMNAMGNSAVGNQQAGYGAGLPMAQFVAGGYGGMQSAAQLQTQGALGLGNLMNQGYQISQQNQGSGLGSMLGIGASLLGAPSTSIFGTAIGMGK